MAPRDGVTYRWDLKAPRDTEPFLLHGGGHGTFDNRHQSLALSGSGILVYNFEQPPFYEFHGLVPTQGSSNVRFTPDGKSWISGFTEDGISLHQMPGDRHSQVQRLWNRQQWTAQSLDVDPQGRYVAAVADGVYLISLQGKGDIKLKGKSQFENYSCVAFSRDGNRVAAVIFNDIEVWDLAKGDSRILQNSSATDFSQILFSQDGSLYSSDMEGTIRRRNPADGTNTKIADGSGTISDLAISNDKRFLALSSWSGNNSILKVYDLQYNTSSIISSHGNRVDCVTFDPVGTRLITGDAEGMIRVGPITGETSLVLYGHKSAIVDVSVHPDGKWILSGEQGNPIIRLWRMPHGKPLQSLPLDQFQNAIREQTKCVW